MTDQNDLAYQDDQWLIWHISLLALLIWREARSESFLGKVAVGYSVRNRVEHPKWWGNTYSAVMAKKWQYSSLAAPGDPQLMTWPVFPDDAFTECLDVADRVIHGTTSNPCPEADSYYATYIAPPKWALDAQFVVLIGQHKFYNTDGSHPENDTTGGYK